jgi:hypothetical protein
MYSIHRRGLVVDRFDHVNHQAVREGIRMDMRYDPKDCGKTIRSQNGRRRTVRDDPSVV